MARAYQNGSVTVSTTPTLIANVGAENDGVLIQNTGAAAIFVGGPSVATSGANLGISVAAGATLLVPSVGGSAVIPLYGIIATGTAAVVFLYPSA